MNSSKIFSNAVAISDERRLLGREQLTRLSSAGYDDAIKMLKDYGYADSGESVDLDVFFYAQTLALVEYIKENCPDKFLLRILLNRYLYVNAKAVYKSKITKKRAEGYGFFSFDEEELTTNPFIAAAYKRLDEKNETDARAIDVALTQAMYDDNLYCASKSRDRLLKRYVAAEIDLKNVITCLRASRLKRSFEFADEMLVNGGKLSKDRLSEVYEGGVAALENTELSGITADDAVEVEALGDEYLLATALSKRINFDSISPFFGYCIKKSMELKTVKMILTCIKNGVPREIDKRLRCYYD